MVRKTETLVTLTDDIDGTKAERTIAFTFDGVNYEIELGKKNAAAFEKAMTPYIKAGRRTRGASGGKASRSAGGSSRTKSRSDLTEIREWAKASGIEVSERGRIAQTVLDAYDAAR